MSDISSLRKVFSALVTPMRSDESVDLGVLRELVERQLSRGVEGFYCCGSSGEGLLLSHQERRDVVRTVVEQAAGRVPTIAHVGTIRTQDAIDLARAAAADGVTAVSLIPPYYYHWTAAEVLGYYRAVVAAVQVPVVLYNIPQFTRISFDVSNVGDLFADPQVVGMKHTAHDLYTLERLVTQYPEKVFLNGFDEIYLSALAAGATATVGTTVNFQPELFLRVRERFVAGDLAEARTIQTQINCAVEVAVRHGIFPSAKYLAGAPDLPTGDCRAPFRPLDADAKRALEELRCRIVEFTAG